MATAADFKDNQKRWFFLLEALRATPNETTCQTCLGKLNDYVAAQLAGEDALSLYPDVAVHLDTCLDCAGAYARLYELELAMAAERLPEPPRLPAPDLSFLPATPHLRPIALAEQVRQALSRAGNQLVFRLSAGLLSLLASSPAPVSLRAPADTQRYTEVVCTLEPDESLRSEVPFTLTAYRDGAQPDHCLVEVVVEPPGRSWPDLEGITVALTLAGVRREATTDAWGLVSFAGLPIARLADLTLEIEL
jgi:hypothetical protein